MSVLRPGEVLWDSTGDCFEASLRLASKDSRVF